MTPANNSSINKMRIKRYQREQTLLKRHQSSFEEIQYHQPATLKKQIHASLTFESGPMLRVKCELDRLWTHYSHCSSSLINNVTLKIGAKKSLNRLLTRKKSFIYHRLLGEKVKLANLSI